MLRETLDDRYLNWLISRVGTVKVRRQVLSHRSLFEQLHETIFVPIVAHDDNRVEDAKDLRYEFLADVEDEQGDLRWMRSPCSMLELLIILSKQLAFEMDDRMEAWFWHLLQVLDLEQFDDHEYDDKAQEVIAETMDRVIWRKYAPDGHGGLFPLRDAARDQRNIELWYQLNAYLLEQF